MRFSETQNDPCEPPPTTAVASDADAHALIYQWSIDGVPFGRDGADAPLCGFLPGTYVLSVEVSDGRGGTATGRFTLTIESVKEIVLWAADAEYFDDRWRPVADATAAGGTRAYDPNLGRPKVAAPGPAFENSPLILSFHADPRLTYKLWIRLKADGNSWANDSVWVQFMDATDEAGNPKYRWDSTSGLAVNLEECSGCGLSGWGWEDDGWGAPNKNGVLLRFPLRQDGDPHSILIQTREDGVSIDQVVLSAERYLTTRPGAAKNDNTILPRPRQ